MDWQQTVPLVGKHLLEKLIKAKPPGFKTLCISWKISCAIHHQIVHTAICSKYESSYTKVADMLSSTL